MGGAAILVGDAADGTGLSASLASSKVLLLSVASLAALRGDRLGDISRKGCDAGLVFESGAGTEIGSLSTRVEPS